MEEEACFGEAVVQAKGDLAEGNVDNVTATAAAGVRGSGAPLPHLERIQKSFGPHDISGIRAHVGGKAAESAVAIGANAYAIGGDVGFVTYPTLHTAAHEAAHVIQQRQGVQLEGGVGQAGDVYERNADAVADRVVAGERATDLLGPGGAGSDSGAKAVQLDGAGVWEEWQAQKKVGQAAFIISLKKRIAAGDDEAIQERKKQLLQTLEILHPEVCSDLHARTGPGGDLYEDIQRLSKALRVEVRTALRKRAMEGGKEVGGTSKKEGDFVPPALPVARVARASIGYTPVHYRFWAFAIGSAELHAGWSSALEEAGNTLANYPKTQAVIMGHTSESGDGVDNQELSVERADAIANELIARGMRARQLISAVGFGENAPLVAETNAKAMATNRRVELHLAGVDEALEKEEEEERKKKKKKKKDKAPPKPKYNSRWGVQVPCDQADYNEKYYETLIMVWTSELDTQFIDRGGGQVGVKPEYTDFKIAAMGAGFSHKEAYQLYQSYPGETTFPSLHTINRWKAERAVARENQSTCDSSQSFTPGPFMLEPIQPDDTSRAKKRDPEPGDVSPTHGQRY
jgi:hypothetical protein